LTVWNHAHEERARRLKNFKNNLKANAVGGRQMSYSVDGINLFAGSTTTLDATGPGSGGTRIYPGQAVPPRRGNVAWRAMSGRSDYFSASEDGQGSDSDVDGTRRRHGKSILGMSQLRESTIVSDINEDAEAMFGEGEDLYWVPYALTLGALVWARKLTPS
jgi:hypothetical protein